MDADIFECRLLHCSETKESARSMSFWAVSDSRLKAKHIQNQQRTYQQTLLRLELKFFRYQDIVKGAPQKGTTASKGAELLP